MPKSLVYIIVLLSIGWGIQAAILPDTTLAPLSNVRISNGDTIFYAEIQEIEFLVSDKNTREKNRSEKQNQRFVYNVKKAYYYARLVNDKLKEIDATLHTIKGKKEQKEYLDRLEVELRNQYEDELKKLTITQGRILVKLIDREAGNTTYYYVKELRGTFAAFFWQSLARIFGSNLKTKYDPLGADKDIEEVVQLIEKGLL